MSICEMLPLAIAVNWFAAVKLVPTVPVPDTVQPVQQL
jgi:hypothetical protein